MNRAIWITVGALALAWSDAAAAASYTDTHTLSLVQNVGGGTYYSENFNWAGFNTALGTLTGVQIDLNGAYTAQGSYPAYAGQTVTYTANGAETLYFNGTFADFGSATAGSTAVSAGGLATIVGAAIGSRSYASATDLNRFMFPIVGNMLIGYPSAVRFNGTPVSPSAQPTILSQKATVGITFFYAAVPEPATWTTMMLGLVMTGAALRHRRRRATVGVG